MEQRYALLPFVLLVSGSFAQTPFEHADQRTFNVGYSDCVDFSGGFAVSGWLSDDNASPISSYIRGLDMNGTLLWEHIPQTQFAQLADPALAGFSDGTFLAAGGLFDCDFFLPYFLAERIDPTGSVLWSHTYSFGMVNDAAINTGDSIAYTTDYGILVTDAQGDSLTSFDTQPYYSSSITWEPGPALITGSWGGQLARWALDGSATAATDLPGNIVDLLFWQGHRLVLTDDGWLRTLDEDLVPLDSIHLGTGSNYGQLLPHEDLLLVVRNDSTFTFDAALAPSGAIAMDPDDDFPGDLFRAFATRDDLLLMAATSTTGQRPAGLVRSVTLNGAHAPHTEDVSIDIVSIDNTNYTLQNGLVYPHVNLTARITNLSDLVLDKVMACHFGYVDFICGMYGTTVLINDANLAPGDPLDVPMYGLGLAPMPLEGFNPDRPVCISALSPNDLYDRDGSDNYACDTAHIVLGMRNLEMDDLGLVVSNPFAEAIDLLFTMPSKEPLRATLFDATGRQLATTSIFAGSTILHWELPGLSDGVHMLQVAFHYSSTTRKLIRQRP